jgi:hypothetical protein
MAAIRLLIGDEDSDNTGNCQAKPAFPRRQEGVPGAARELRNRLPVPPESHLGDIKKTRFLPKKVLRLINSLLYLTVLTAVCIEREGLRATAITLRMDLARSGAHRLDATYVLRTFLVLQLLSCKRDRKN